MVCIYNGVLLSHIKDHIWVSSSKVDKPRPCYTEWSKSKREKQISYINAYVWSLDKWSWRTYLQGSNRDADMENRLADTVAEGEGRKNWESYQWNIYMIIGKIHRGFCLMMQGAQPSALGGRFKKEGPYIHLWLIHVDVWQKSIQHFKAIILHLKINTLLLFFK